MKLEEIHWPVFLLKGEEPYISNGISMYGSALYDTELNKEVYKFKVIDDKNIPGNTLGERRLQMSMRKIPLYNLKKAVYSLGDLLRISSNPNLWLIDSIGTLFKYKKSVRAPLTCHKIVKVLRNSKGMCIIELEGIHERFKIMNDIKECKYAGLITINKRYILYGLYEIPFKRTYRKV